MDMEKALERARRRYPKGSEYHSAHLSDSDVDGNSVAGDPENFAISEDSIIETYGGKSVSNVHGYSKVMYHRGRWATPMVPETLPEGSWIVSMEDHPASIMGIKKYELHKLTGDDRVYLDGSSYHLWSGLSPNAIRWFPSRTIAQTFLEGIEEVLPEVRKTFTGSPLIELSAGDWVKVDGSFRRILSITPTKQASNKYWYNSIVYDRVIVDGIAKEVHQTQNSSSLDKATIKVDECDLPLAEEPLIDPKLVRVGDVVRIQMSSGNWHRDMDRFDGEEVIVKSVTDNQVSGVQITFDMAGSGNWVWTSRNNHYRILRRTTPELVSLREDTPAPTRAQAYSDRVTAQAMDLGFIDTPVKAAKLDYATQCKAASDYGIAMHQQINDSLNKAVSDFVIDAYSGVARSKNVEVPVKSDIPFYLNNIVVKR